MSRIRSPFLKGALVFDSKGRSCNSVCFVTPGTLKPSQHTMSNMGTSSSYRRAEGETTEWEDILIAKGIIAPKKDPNEDARKAAFEEEVERVAAAVDPLAKKTLDELDELEQDDDDLADSRIIESYRQARLEQIKAAAARNKFGMVSVYKLRPALDLAIFLVAIAPTSSSSPLIIAAVPAFSPGFREGGY